MYRRSDGGDMSINKKAARRWIEAVEVLKECITLEEELDNSDENISKASDEYVEAVVEYEKSRQELIKHYRDLGEDVTVTEFRKIAEEYGKAVGNFEHYLTTYSKRLEQLEVKLDAKYHELREKLEKTTITSGELASILGIEPKYESKLFGLKDRLEEERHN